MKSITFSSTEDYFQLASSSATNQLNKFLEKNKVKILFINHFSSVIDKGHYGYDYNHGISIVYEEINNAY